MQPETNQLVAAGGPMEGAEHAERRE